jgi:hypothetical protein
MHTRIGRAAGPSAPGQNDTHIRIDRWWRKPRPKKRSNHSTGSRFSQRLGPLQVSVSYCQEAAWLRVSVWGTGLRWEHPLWRSASMNARRAPWTP